MKNFSQRWIWITIFTFFFTQIPRSEAQSNIEIKGYSDQGISSEFHQLYLVFAGPYTASPSSAFGHLFLLIEPNEESEENLQLWHSVNYAANVDGHSGISTLFNGVIGNLEGQFEVLPFYKKIRDYSYSESRDLWLFPIDLNQSEKQRFAEFINSNIEKESQYRFVDKNCATRVLEALNYTFEIKNNDGTFILPQEVVTNKYIEKRLSESLWIENVESQLLNVYKSIQNDEVDNVTDGKFNKGATTQVLKTYEWLYNNSSVNIDDEKIEFIRSLRLQAANQESDLKLQELQLRPFIIHNPGRVGAAYSYDNEFGSLINLDIRMGLHDFVDRSSVFPKFDYLNLLNLDLQLRNKTILIDEIWGFHQSSRQPANDFNSPASWTIGVGGRRYDIDLENEFAVGAYLGVGKTYSIFEEDWTSTFILNVNPVYIYRGSWNVVLDPSIEQRIFFSDRLKAMIKINNPWYLRDEAEFNIQQSINLIYNLYNNISLNVLGTFGKHIKELRTGFNFNFPY